jgi:hypothetical protein
MSKSIPKGVIWSAILGIIIGAILVCVGALFLLSSSIFLHYSEYGSGVWSVGKIYEILGLSSLFTGILCIIVGVCLLFMKDWAREYGAPMFMILAIGSLCLLILFFSAIICTAILLLVAIFSFLCYHYLKSPHTRDMFDVYGYERSSMTTLPSSRRYQMPGPEEEEKKPVAQAKVNVPGNMVMCHGCQTLNRKTDYVCRFCGGNLKK